LNIQRAEAAIEDEEQRTESGGKSELCQFLPSTEKLPRGINTATNWLALVHGETEEVPKAHRI
jgi:hypothetical protein